MSANTPPIVRRAVAEDAPALALVASATFLDTFAGVLHGPDIVAHCVRHNAPAKFAAWLGDGESVVTLAEASEGRAPLGYTVLTEPDLPIETGKSDIELKRIYTLSRLHGTGLGTELMERALSDARAQGFERVLLGVYGGNARARAFYERHGFTPAGTRRFPVGETWHDDIVYARSA